MCYNDIIYRGWRMLGMNNKKFGAYTLAEMLMVLLIFSLIMLAAPPLTKKLHSITITEKKHGRFECYYDASGKLVQYKAVDGQPAGEPTEVADESVGCVFNPPSNALYIMIHAVGGGGAGYANIGTVGDSNNPTENVVAISYPSYSAVELWPDWFRYLMNHNESDIKNLSMASNSYEIKKTFRDQKLHYGLSGMAGERVSMFFPTLSSQIQISMKPGKGALTPATAKGGDTTVSFKYPSDINRTQVILAEGGESGKENVPYSSALQGGIPTDFGVGKMQSAVLKSSSFEDVIENANSRQASMINADNGAWTQKAGWGGNGAYFYLGGSALNGAYTYQTNNFEQEIDDEGNFKRKNYWKTVTNLLPLYFYKRDGQTGNCSLTSGDIEVSGYCYQGRGATDFTCRIKDGDMEYTRTGYSACYSGNCLSETTAGTLKNCKFKPSTVEYTCTKENVSNSTHSCTYSSGSSIDDFTCPDGIVTEKKNENYGICKAGQGGNGAVIILW